MFVNAYDTSLSVGEWANMQGYTMFIIFYKIEFGKKILWRDAACVGHLKTPKKRQQTTINV